MAERPFYVFGPFHLDATGRLLLRGHEPVPLPPKAIDTLLVLVENAGTVVSKEHLLKQVWQDAFVEDGSLTRAISVLRKALGDGEDGQEFIATISRRGYRFTAPVTVVEDGTVETAIHPLRKRLAPWIWVGSAMAVLLAVVVLVKIGGLRSRLSDYQHVPIRSIVILPLANLSGDPAQDYFADGMTDELITEIAQVASLRVISRTSAMHYKGTAKTAPEIASELNVDSVLEGSVARSGDHVRITAQLIEARADKQLWANSYEGESKDALEMQDAVARDV